MKTKLGIVIIMFLTGIFFGAAQPAIVYAGPETGGGTLWDPFIDPHPYPGTKLTGTLSIIYNPNLLAAMTLSDKCSLNGGLLSATMFYSVRFSVSSQIYTFVGATEGVCLGDVGQPGSGGQGDLIKAFLGNAVNTIFPGKGWKLKAVKQPGIDSNSFGFVADVVLAVQ